MDPAVWLIGLVTVLVIYYLLARGDKSYPSGPLSFPFVGNLPQLFMIGSISKFAEYYRKQYGNVYSFEFGGGKRVVISGYDAIRNLLVKNADHTSNRVTSSLSENMRDRMSQTPGLMWAPYPHWKTLRSFALTTLREEGMGKSAMEGRIMDEVELYIEHFLKPNLGKPFSVFHNLNQATSNIISQLLFARRFDYDDKNFNSLIAGIDELIQLTMNVAILGSLPFGSLLTKSAAQREKELFSDVIRPILQSCIDENKQTLDRENPRDFTDQYIIHSETAEGEKKQVFSDANGIIAATQLYVAGTETTSTALKWALLYMCLHPEVKEKVQGEIDDIIGPSRAATFKDRLSMPYTDAVLLECLRKGNIVHASLPHVADQELVVDGVKIPAGSDLMLNMTSVLYDETVFEEPNKFKPERYLTGDIALKKQRTIPFGIGRRVCLGESLAKMEFFMFFVTFLQRFDVSVPDGESLTDQPNPNNAAVRGPSPYQLVFVARH